MYTINEGEVILKEKYGSSARERFYVKPPEQGNIVILDEQHKLSNLTGWFTRVFLPQGYPDSVSKDYLPYQIWDTAQAFCSTITGILATQEVLRGVGVGDTSATPLAATITWVIKDGCGHIGRILFAFSHGYCTEKYQTRLEHHPNALARQLKLADYQKRLKRHSIQELNSRFYTYLDAYSKKWRLYADTLNDAAMCIEIALPLFKNYTTFALCVSTVMKAIVGVAGGATRIAMTQHHAVRGNMADVAAKDAAQETAVNLIASLAALLIITLFGNSIIIFLIMMILHITFNYFAVRAVCLKTINEPRFLQVIDMYIRKEVIATPCEINQNEPIIFYQLGPNLLDLKIAGFQIKLGASIRNIIKENPQAMHLKNIKEVYEERNYVLLPDLSKRKMFVLIKDVATTDDILCAYFHAVLLSIVTCAINDDDSHLKQNTIDPRPFAQVCHMLQSAEWSREPIENMNSISRFSYEPSIDLMRYIDKIVNKEWYITRGGMLHTGWDLSKHLLMVDEWRICGETITTKKPISEERLSYSETIVNRNSKIPPFRENLTESDMNVISEDDCFTIDPDHDLDKSRQKSRSKLRLEMPNQPGPIILEATEVKPEILEVKKE